MNASGTRSNGDTWPAVRTVLSAKSRIMLVLNHSTVQGVLVYKSRYRQQACRFATVANCGLDRLSERNVESCSR